MRHYLLHKVSSRLIFSLLLVFGLQTAGFAHDSWLMPMPFLHKSHVGIETTTLLPGTGDFFPNPEFVTPSDRIEALACSEAGKPAQANLEDNSKLGFQIKVALTQANVAASCVVQLEREFIELKPEKVDVYLDDIQASPKIRQRWKKMRVSGQPWKERYTKTARAELRSILNNQPSIANNTHQPSEIFALKAGASLKQGQTVDFLLNHHGKPLANQPIQWISGESEQRGWLRSNAKGVIKLPLIHSGSWMLRGTIIRLGNSGEIESDFFTLVFLVPEQPN